MTKKLNIALITDILPDKKFTAGQVLELIVSHTPQALIDIYWLNQSSLPQAEILPPNAMLVCQVRFPQAAPRPSLHPRRILSHLLSDRLKQRLRRLRDLVRIMPSMQFIDMAATSSVAWRPARPPLMTQWRGVHRFAGIALRAFRLGLRLRRQINRKNYDAIWLVLQGEMLAVTYFTLTWKLKKKVILHQWDPIGWWAQHRFYGDSVIAMLNRLVIRLEKRVTANLVPSHAWQTIQQQHGARSLRIDNFFSAAMLLQTKQPLKLATPYQINAVFIGQLYSQQELLTAIQRLLYTANRQGKRVCLHYFGSSSLKLDIDQLEIVNHSYMDRDALIERIRKFDLALLPYPLEKRFEQASTYSFPSKSRVYLAASLPILAVAAVTSSPHGFYTRYYKDYYFNLVQGGDLDGFIRRITTNDAAAIEQRMAAANRLINDHFSEQVELGPVHQLLEEIAA